MRRTPPPHAYFLVSAVFHYLGPAFAVLLFARVDVLGVAWLRIASAAVVFAVWRRPWRVARAGGRTLVAWGCVLAAMNCCFYLAIDRLALGTVAAIEFLPVIALAALGARTPRNVLALALAVPGVLLLTGVHLEGQATALALAAANAVLFAAYIVLADRVAKHDGVSGVDGLGAAMLVAAVAVTPVAGPATVPALGDPVAILAGIGVGLCSSVVPYVADQLALARLPRATYALMVSLLPATATVIGIVVLTQVPSARESAGVALVVAGVALHRPGESLAGPAAVGTRQRNGMRMRRSSSGEGSPRPSRLLVVSQSASPDGSTATVRMRPNSPSSSA
jgi:inner membrane transporter RhtA